MADILITDDEEDIRNLIADILQDEGFSTRTAGTSDDCMAEIARQRPDLMVLDIWLKDSNMDGIDILREVKKEHPEMPIVIISGHGNIEIAVAAIKQGAYDFIEKPFNIDQLLVVIRRAMETARLRRENIELRHTEQPPVQMVGESAAFRNFRTQLDKVVRSNGRVMLRGAPGSGKETAARYIHAQSARSSANFVAVPAASLVPDAMESMLFGRESPEEGLVPGLMQQADGGVLYLDEITDLPSDSQSKFLRAIIDQKFQPVGSAQTIQVDLRVISSTNCDLEAEVASGRFREELYHRLNVVPITVPSLSEHSEDIPELARHFIREFHESQGLPLRELSDDAAAGLQALPWPGNLHQLRNLVERILIMGEEDKPIGMNDLPGQQSDEIEEGRLVLAGSLATLPLREARELFEREYLLTQINRFGGNISKTASFVGMERSALHRKLKSLGIVTTARGGARIATLEPADGPH